MGVTLGKVWQINLAPLFTNKQGEKLKLGLGPIYQYTRDTQNKTSSGQFGARAMGRFIPKKSYPYLQTEAEAMNGNGGFLDGTDKSRDWYMAYMLGAGHTFPLGEHSGVDIAVLRILNWNGQTPIHFSPWVVRMGWRW